MEGTLEKVSEITRSKDIPIFWGCTCLAIVTFALLPLNETDFNRLDFIAPDTDIKQYYDEVSSHYNRGFALNYGIDIQTEWTAIEPDFLRRVEQFSSWC